MYNLEWNDGMSVGIEAIDNDHKILLLLINEIADAFENTLDIEVVENIFKKLEDYACLHFSREEALMSKYKYNNQEKHVEQHQMFTNKILELKQQLLKTHSIKIAKEINLFLFNWLVNHIIAEDMNFFQFAGEHGLTTIKEPKTSMLDNLAAWLGSRLVLHKRIFMTSLLPIVGTFLLSIVIFWSSFQQFRNMHLLLELNQTVSEINKLSHSIQAERGLSTGFIGSKYHQFFPTLTNRRTITDALVQDFLQKLNNLSPKLIDKEMLLHINTTKEQLARLAEQRKQIDKRASSVMEMQRFYTELVKSLLDIPNSAMPNFEIDADIAHNITVFISIMNLKETVGQERALGTLVIEKGYFTAAEFQLFAHLLGKQYGFLQIFQHSATDAQKITWKRLCGGKIADDVNELETLIYKSIRKDQVNTMNAQRWFEVMSSKVDQLKLIAEQLVIDIANQVNKKANQLKQKFYLTSAVLGIILLLTILSSWLLNHSIIYPVRRITYAMTRLSQGYRDIRFTNKFAHDELGEMVNAYEQCRRCLLQADVASTIKFQKQDIDLQVKNREKELYKELAATDSLTGAFNRRKFDDLASREVDRFYRYNRPLSIMMLDIDHFKNINDTYGHSNGDLVLREFYQICLNAVRNTDIVARIGGDEFVVLMPETNLQPANILAKRICKTVSKFAIVAEDSTIKITVSIGVTKWNTEGFKSINDILEYADQALYEAKKSGRNRVVAFS